MASMRLFVGKRAIHLPSRWCSPEDVQREVKRRNPPLVVRGADGHRFSVGRRVFFAVDDVQVECEGEGELRLACKLSAERHNGEWQNDEDTEAIESAVAEHMAAPSDDEDESQPREEEDISIQEWEQLGYKWFRREDVLYI
jgi:hypothetical protein